jgi:hypothetical protein
MISTIPRYKIIINFKKIKTMFKLFKKALMPIQSKNETQTIIEKIHNEFDTAGEKLLAEANEVLNGNYDIEKGERLQRIGFTNSRAAIDADTVKKMKVEKKKQAETVEYFRTFYPNNKFITEELVKIICEKYNLVFGGINYYKGDVPEKNLTEIENFKLREEDKDDCYDYYDYSQGLGNMSGISALQSLGQSDIDRMYERAMMQAQRPIYKGTPNGKKEQKGFKICAPENDFDMRYMVRSGHKIELHIPDPVVLQPVKGGYLVVSKWGIEAEDASLVNEKLN